MGELGTKNLSQQDPSQESPGELEDSDLSWLLEHLLSPQFSLRYFQFFFHFSFYFCFCFLGKTTKKKEGKKDNGMCWRRKKKTQ